MPTAHLDLDALHVGLVLEDELLQEEERALVRHALSHLCNKSVCKQLKLIQVVDG